MAQQILDNLTEVERLRRRRRDDPNHARSCLAIKTYQAERFRHTYADLLADADYAPPALFFLDELYGPQDFERRDTQFGRVVPAVSRLFKGDVLATVHQLSELHRISEQLDTVMAGHLASSRIGPAEYLRAWQECGHRAQRRDQIELTCAVGTALVAMTRRKVLRVALRVMRRPAHATGLSELQNFLETGFDTFALMPNPNRFLEAIREREYQLAKALFDAPAGWMKDDRLAIQHPLHWLPDTPMETEVRCPAA